MLTGWCPEGYKDVENRACALKKLRGKWRIKVITSQVVNEKLMLRHNRVIIKYMAPGK